jgi:hypothetical protein
MNATQTLPAGSNHPLSRLKGIWGWLKWPVALVLLSYLFYKNWPTLAELRRRELLWGYLAIAFCLSGTSILLTFYRWYLLVWAQDFPFRVRDAMRLGFIGVIFNYVGPGLAGGDLVKAGMIAAEQKSRKGVAAATVLLDRILGLLALFQVGSLAAFFQDPALLENGIVRICVAVLWCGSLAGSAGVGLMLIPAVPRSRGIAWLTRLPKVGKMIGGLVNAMLLYQSRGRILIAAILISIVGHFGMLSSFYFCSRAIQAGSAAPGYWAHLLLIPGAEVAAVFVPTPAGVGALEGGVELWYGIANEAAKVPVSAAAAKGAGLATAFAYRAITLLVAAIGAGYYLTSRSEIKRVLAENDDS